MVGSAWEGQRKLEDKPVDKLPAKETKLLELARKQRMNTDVRRSIFCVIVAAEVTVITVLAHTYVIDSNCMLLSVIYKADKY